MRITIIAVGKMKSGPERELVERYLSRARASGKNLGLKGFEVIELGESRARSAPARKAEEAKDIFNALGPNASYIALDETGNSQTSEKFARQIAQSNDTGDKNLCFIIGGADGLDPSISKQAKRILNFSTLTWPHQIVRILLAEQLYRMTTILSGHPYHRQ